MSVSVLTPEPEARTSSAWDDAADGCFTIKEAVAFSGLSRTRIYELLKAGALRSTIVGSRRLIFRKSLREVLARGATRVSSNALGER